MSMRNGASVCHDRALSVVPRGARIRRLLSRRRSVMALLGSRPGSIMQPAAGENA